MSSLATTLRKAAYAAPLVFAAAANVNAAPPTIEPSSTNLTKPYINGCVKTTPGQPGMTAWDKLVTVMTARGQMIVGSGDKLAPTGRFETILTISNNFSGGEAYIIDSGAVKGKHKEADGFCITPLRGAAAYDIATLSDVPKVLDKGELGIALRNQHKVGSKVAYAGATLNGSLVVVHFNQNSGKGSMIISNNLGMQAGDSSYYINFDYWDKMKKVFEVGAENAKNKANTKGN